MNESNAFNIQNLLNNKSNEKTLLIEEYFSVWSMIKLNPIEFIDEESNKSVILNLVAIGLSNGRIFIINLSTMKIHQKLSTINTIYSLVQFKDNPKYLLCSLSNGYIIIYKLIGKNYIEIQKLQKPNDLGRSAINKIIILSNGDIISGEKGNISLWRQKRDFEGNIIEGFIFVKEIYKDFSDICHLIEVKNNTFACGIYGSNVIKIFKNKEDSYDLMGTINHVEIHGNNSNGMAKINDKLFCCGGKNYFIYIISVEPPELIQTIKLVNEESTSYICFMHATNDGLFLFTSYYEKIVQLKIVKDRHNNFIELKKYDEFEDKKSGSPAIVTTSDGKILYQKKSHKIEFCLRPFKMP